MRQVLIARDRAEAVAWWRWMGVSPDEVPVLDGVEGVARLGEGVEVLYTQGGAMRGDFKSIVAACQARKLMPIPAPSASLQEGFMAGRAYLEQQRYAEEAYRCREAAALVQAAGYRGNELGQQGHDPWRAPGVPWGGRR